MPEIQARKSLLAKRLSSLTQLLVVIWIVSLLAWTQKIEASNLKSDLVILNALEDINSEGKYRNRVEIKEILSLNKDNNFAEKNFADNAYSNIRLFLEKKEKDSYKSMIDARQELTDWLSRQGISENNLNQLSGKGGNNKIPFYFFEFLDDQNLNSQSIEDESSGFTVSNLLHKLEQLIKEQKIQVVKRIKTLPSEANYGFNLGSPTSIRLENSIIKIEHNSVAQDDTRIWIPVETSNINVPSLLELIDLNESSTSTLKNLAKNNKKKEAFKDVYGTLPFDQAVKVASNGLVEAYKKINILGFSISARKLPWAAFLFSLSAMVGIFLTLQEAKNNYYKIITYHQDEKVINLIIENKLSRVAVWCILPVSSLIISLPIIELSTMENFCVFTSSLLLLFIGTINTYNSQNL